MISHLLDGRRLSTLIPLAAATIALYVFLAPVPAFVSAECLSKVLSYDVFRADALWAGCYSGAMLAMVMMVRCPSRITAVAGTVCCWVPLLISYAWTVSVERYFGVLLATITIPTTYLSFNPWVDRLDVGLVVLAGAIPACYIARRASFVRVLTVFFDFALLAIVPLVLGVRLFDYAEINQPVASRILSVPTNEQLLLFASAYLAAAALLELLPRVRPRRPGLSV